MKQLDGYMHGINLGGWLSQCDHTVDRYENFIREEDIRAISKWGLDHIRVPIDYDLVEDQDGKRKEEGFAYIQRALDWCDKYGLNMILDLHKTFGFSFDRGEQEEGFFVEKNYQERFYRLWEELAGRYGHYEDRLCLELLNEVTDKSYCEAWNRIAAQCIARIRAIAPTIKILVGGYYNNSIVALKDLNLPADENIVYNFHCYEPLNFTHQGAHWVDGMSPDFRMSYESSIDDLLEDLMKEAVRVAEERNVALYCGEYGVINLATAEDTLTWYRSITRLFDRYGIGRAAWSYKKMDFGIADEHLSEARQLIIETL